MVRALIVRAGTVLTMSAADVLLLRVLEVVPAELPGAEADSGPAVQQAQPEHGEHRQDGRGKESEQQEGGQ